MFVYGRFSYISLDIVSDIFILLQLYKLLKSFCVPFIINSLLSFNFVFALVAELDFILLQDNY